MNVLKNSMLASVLVLGTAQGAQAATMASMPFFVATNEGVSCSLLNLGKKPATVTVELVSVGGAVLKSIGPSSLFTGSGAQVSSSADILANSYAYCRFTVSGSAKTYRAGVLHYDLTTNATITEFPAF